MASKYDQYLSGDTGTGATDRARALTDKYSSILAQPDRDRAQVNMLDEPQPDVAARARRYETELGVPAPVAAADIKGFDAQARQRKVASAIDANPSLAGIMANPLKAMGLYDDIDEMMKLATAAKTPRPTSWVGRAGQVLSNIGTAAKASAYGTLEGVYGSVLNYVDLQEKYDITANIQRSLFGGTIYDPVQAFARSAVATDKAGREAASAEIDRNTYGFIERELTRGVESIVPSVAGLGFAAAGMPQIGLGIIGGVTQGQSYTRARDEGMSEERATLFAATDTAIETVTEAVPILKFFGDTKAGTPFFKRLASNLVAENIGEQTATALQDLNQWASIDSNKGKTFRDYLAERPEAAAQTLLATTAMVGATNTVVGAVEQTAKAAHAVANARHNGGIIETIMGSAEKHASRTRDPETFREFVAAQTDDTPAENVYVPVEAVETLLQSGNLTDGEQAVFGRLSDQIAEARQTGGDIVIPMADAATLLAGTKAWEALKDDARIDAGGLSPREAREQSAQIEATLEQRGQEIIGAAGDEIAERDPAVQVYMEVRQQLVDAGFTPDAANKQAAIFAANREAWGARLGQTAAEYHAANPVEFRRELAGIASTDGAMLDQVRAGVRLYHGSPNTGMALDDIQIIRAEGQKQGKRGRVYGGFYAASEDRLSDAEEYAGKGGTVYQVDLTPGVVVEDKQGDITRLTEQAIAEYRSRGVDVVRGRDPRGRVEYAVINRDAIAGFAPRGVLLEQASLSAADGGLTQIGDVSARFSPAAVGNLMASDDWAILTAENPMGEQADELTNRRAMDALKADLAALGVSFTPAVGKYGQVENSFVVVGITRAQAIALGRKYDQDSVLTREGLVYQDGSINPATGSVETFTDRPDDFFTEVPSTGAKFAVGIDFDQRIAPTSEETTIALTQNVDRALRINAPVADVRIAKDGSLLIVADFEPNPAHNAKLAKLMRDSAIEKVRANSAAVLGDTPFRVVLPGDKALAGSTPSALEAPPVDADGKITLQHFSSRDDLTVLDPTHWGTNANFLPPTERAQIGTAPPRTYFGIATNQPGGYVKEFGEGAAEYTARIDASALYDAAGNPDGFTGSSIERDRAVIEAGYLGYWKKDPSLGLVAVVFTPTEVEAVRGDRTFYQITPDQAVELNTPVDLPSAPEFAEAVSNTETAVVTEDGLRLTTVRVQKPEQEGGQSVRTGVFYLPKGSANLRHYKGSETAYGGTEKFEGETLLRRPLFVKGATGGKAPEAAYDALKGKGSAAALGAEAQSVATSRAALGQSGGLIEENISNFLEKHGVEGWRAYDILANSRKGNQLRYALQEIVVAHAVREAGYDAVLGYSKGKKGAFLSEIFDVRELTYPARGFESEVHEAFTEGEFPLFQTTGKPRGQIQFTADGRSVITLFEEADLSTLLHETGHLFFEELKRNALAPNAPADVVADWNAIKKWLKENGQPVVRNQITREGHELMARGFERYLMEGKAPSRDLAGAFATFRSWLVRIYQVVQSLRSPITPEVRAVFDRMLATQQAIDEYAGQQNQVEIDEKSATAMGMTGAEFVAYRESVIGAKREAYDTLLKKTMHAIRVRETKRYKDAAKGVREDVTASVYAEPRFIALRLLRTGRWLNDENRPAQKMTLDREWLTERFGATAIEQLPKGPMLVKTNGDDADMIAEQVGFGSGEAMVRALFEIETEQQELRLAGDKRQVMDKLIDDQVEAIMAQRTEGDALTDGSLEEEAIAAVNGEQQGAVLSTELRYLARRTRASPTPYRMAREWAARKIRAGRVNDVASRAAMQRYSRASAKAAKLAEEAIIAGDYDEAFRQKQAQMLNHALLAEAKAAGDEIDIIVKRMNRLASRATMASVDQDYMDRIHDLLEKYDFRPKSQRWLNEVESFARWAAEQAESGYEVLVPERLLGDGQHYSRISVDTLFGLRDAVGSLLKLGKLKQSIIDAQEERTFAAFIDEIKANLAQMAGRKQTTEINDKDRWSAAALAPLIKIETLADDMDRGNANGPMNRLLVQRATQAENRREELRDRVTKRIAQAYLGMNPKARKRLEEKVTIPEWLHKGGALDERNGQPVSMTRMELLSIALNTGNQGNLEKLARGEGWPVAAIQTALRRELNKSDWDFVQDIWDAVDSLWPDIAAAERNLSGVVPEKVMPLEVDTPFGAYRGGYYPVVYDPNRSGTAEKNADNAANDLFGMASGVATPKGHTITRTAAVGPILRSVEGVLFGHIEKVVTRIAYAEYARDVLRVIQHPEVRSAMDLKLGREYRRQIKPWLQRQISGGQVDPRGLGWWEKFSRSARTNMSIVAMGLRWSTGVAQIAGLTSSAARVGVVPLADGIRRTLQNPAAASRFVFDRSPEMAKRNEAMNREVAEFFREVRGKNTLLNRARGMAFWHIGMIDRYVVSVPTWLAAHSTAIGQGLTDAQASAVADKAVRQSQGSGREKDMANWQSPPSEPMRWLTLFYTYFNVVLNAQWETGRAANRGDWRKAASLSFWFLVAAPLADALLSGDLPDPDDEDETWEGWAARNMFFNLWSGVPVARDLSAFSERKIMGEYATLGATPIQRIEEVSVNAYKVVDKLATEGELDDKWLKTAIETPGYFMGLPTGQPAATAQFLWDYSNGDTDPQGFNQWYWGLSKGKVPDEE